MASVHFQVVHTRKQIKKAQAGVVVLEPTPWDDYGVKCTFAVLTHVRGELEQIGRWKIVNSQNPREAKTELPARFAELPAGYVSLGQEVGGYRRLAQLGPELCRSILRGLRDLVFRPDPGLYNTDWIGKTLARFASARNALEQGGHVLQEFGLLASPSVQSKRGTIDVSIGAQLRGFPTRHELTLSFARTGPEAKLQRIVVLVGPNGSGKTQLLAALARALSGLESSDVSTLPGHPFSLVIAVAYGAFDHFFLPRISTAPISYVYCGLRVPEGDQKIVLDMHRAIREAVKHMTATYRSSRREAWHKALKIVGLGDLVDVVPRGDVAAARYMREHLSAGQKLVALTISNLAAHLTPGSIVLHDEPETHLHPNLLSSLLRAIHFLLDHFDSFAIMATHSAIPAQETPSANVVILDRYDDGSVKAFGPAQQCFAGTLDEISRSIFRARPQDQNFMTVLVDMASTYGADEIRRIFEGDLSLGMRLFLARKEA